ncbi:MAG: GcrA family cell cycle regulator [Beijerinckiaceae bacterium]|nr:GcrA family cell cycle regulator [Beijerinckiaceae bacterium]
MLWNRPPDFTPIPHFLRHDSRNLTAARARIAELRAKERAELVTPPEKLPSWTSFDPSRLAANSKTRELCGDPSDARSTHRVPAPCSAAAKGGNDFAMERAVPPLQRALPAGGSVKLSHAASAIFAVAGCRWPLGDPLAAGFRFCDAKRRGGGSYCEQHARRAAS